MIRALQCCLLGVAAWLSAVTISTVTETRALPRALSVARVLMNEVVAKQGQGARVLKHQRFVFVPPEVPQAPKS